MRIAAGSVGPFTAALLSAVSANAADLWIVVEVDAFGLDGVTPLASLPGYNGEPVFNVYAQFDDRTDQCIGAWGDRDVPFTLWMCGPDATIINHEPDGGRFDTPPTQEQLDAYPELNWDSFCTVGLKISSDADELVLFPGTPGPNTNPWPMEPIDMGWFVPPTIDGYPTPQSIVGNYPDNRVLLMRIVTNGEGLAGTFGVLACRGICKEVPVSIPARNQCVCAGDAASPYGTVDAEDLLLVIETWGVDYSQPFPDFNGDGIVDVEDLIMVILHWGACP